MGTLYFGCKTSWSEACRNSNTSDVYSLGVCQVLLSLSTVWSELNTHWHKQTPAQASRNLNRSSIRHRRENHNYLQMAWVAETMGPTMWKKNKWNYILKTWHFQGWGRHVLTRFHVPYSAVDTFWHVLTHFCFLIFVGSLETRRFRAGGWDTFWHVFMSRIGPLTRFDTYRQVFMSYKAPIGFWSLLLSHMFWMSWDKTFLAWGPTRFYTFSGQYSTFDIFSFCHVFCLVPWSWHSATTCNAVASFPCTGDMWELKAFKAGQWSKLFIPCGG